MARLSFTGLQTPTLIDVLLDQVSDPP